jgi:hypothetical protein
MVTRRRKPTRCSVVVFADSAPPSPRRGAGAEIVRFIRRKNGKGPPAILHNTSYRSSPMRRAVVLKDSGHRTGRRRSRVRSRLVFANGDNSVRHARKCKAALPVANGFIFAVDFPRLFAREVGNSGRRTGGRATIRAGESAKPGTGLTVTGLSGYSRISARARRRRGRRRRGAARQRWF